ncbi:MAG: glycosyltransferase family 39 protein [Candidatus Magasanikbacteria bacterium]|nr:glycosyltransferase family 39 protein [Candidatus Magasanikbacteria bacterium]
MRSLIAFKEKFSLASVRENGLAGILAIVLIIFSVWHLSDSPATWFDEGISLGIAKSLVENGVYSLQVGPHEFVLERPFLITNNYPVLAPVALAIYLAGNDFAAARLPMVLFLWVAAALLYVTARRLYGKECALMSLALVVTFVPFYGNGKAVLGEVPGLVFFLAGLVAWSGEYHPRRWFLAGLLFGLSAATKPFFLIVAPAVLIGETYQYKQTGFWNRIGWLLAGAVGPLIIWLFSILPQFSWQGLQAMVGYYSNSYASDNFFSQIVTNSKRFFTETTPFHFLILFGTIAMAAWTRRRLGEPFKKEEVVLGIFVILNLVWYLKTPGWYRYFFTAHLLLFLLFPAALRAIFIRRRAIALSLVAGLALVQFGYLLTKRDNSFYNSAAVRRITSAIGQIINRNDAVLVINAPSIAFLLPKEQVYQYLQINPVLYFGKAKLSDEENRPYDYIILNGSPDSVSFPGLADMLVRSYRLVDQEEHYTLYRYRL